jgi:hypothetical protein
MKRFLAATAAIGLIAAGLADGAWAKPRFARGGHSGGGGTAQACDGGSSVCVQFQDGQSFVTWTDVNTETTGDGDRYKVYRSNSPITELNYGSATLIGDHILNNSAQSPAGNRTSGSPASELDTFRAQYRADGDNPMLKLTDLGTAQAAFTGLMVHTATGTETAYYAVVSFPKAGGSDTYMGSAGPIAESVQPWKMIQQAASTEPARAAVAGQITSPAGKPVILNLHQSSSPGSCGTISCQYGDLWYGAMDKDSGHWQEGLSRVVHVSQLTSTSFPSGTLTVRPRETIWHSNGGTTLAGTASQEGFWSGLGMTPLSYVGPANKRYLGYAIGLERQLDWLITHYGADRNQIHHIGQSMGAMGIVTTSKMTDTRVASAMLLYPVWRMDLRSSGSWPGTAASWTAGWPFIATVAAAPDTLGASAATVQLPDGAAWGGTGGYTDLFAVIADLDEYFPPVYYGANKYDTSILAPAEFQFQHQLDALDALQTSRRPHAFAWSLGNHDVDPNAVFDCDKSGAVAAECQSKASLRLDRAVFAFSNSSIDDDPGTATMNADYIMDGVHAGVINAGFQWTVTTDTAGSFIGTVDNTYMENSQTTVRQTTLTEAMTATDVATAIDVADGTVFTAGSANRNFIIGGKEIVHVASNNSTSITLGATLSTHRGRFGTTAQTHSIGATVLQAIDIPTGPTGGPYTTMTVDIALWNLQGGAWGSKTCVFTPNGGSPTAPITPTILSNGVPLFTGVTINASGATAIACS